MSELPVRPPAAAPELEDRVLGVLLGTAVGDALGLPFEGLSRQRVTRMLGDDPLRHRFLLGHGLVSDDTEHTCLVAQAALESSLEPERFGRALARRLRLWFLALPPGIGLGTLRAMLKLCLGYSADSSGVRSAGNGPAMRSALLGVLLRDDPGRLEQLVRVSTRITHTDPRAEIGALLIARAAAHGSSGPPSEIDPERFLAEARALDGLGEAGARAIDEISEGLARQISVAELARRLGLERGVSGFIDHTVPVCLYAWLRHPASFREVVEGVVRLGGDTDTTGAIAGAIAGASLGAKAIPNQWVDGLWEWPRSVSWMARLGAALASPDRAPPAEVPWAMNLLRNLAFFAIVLAHVARRAFPPY